MSAGLVLNRSRQVPAEDTPAFGAIAERFRRGGDLDRAVALCRDGLAKFPNHMSARVTLGWALLDLGKYDEAQAELEQVLRRAPDNLAAIRGLAQLHERAENAVMLPLDGPGAWPPEPDTIESAATAAAEASTAPVAPVAQPKPTHEAHVDSAADLIVTGRAPAVDVPTSFAPVALTSAAEMTSTPEAAAEAVASAPAVVEPPAVIAPAATVEAVAKTDESAAKINEALAKAIEPVARAKRSGFLPIQVQPSRVVRPQSFESVVDDEMPIPEVAADANTAAAEAAKAEPVTSSVVDAVAALPAIVEATVIAPQEMAAVAHISEFAAVTPLEDEEIAAPIASSFAAPSFVEPIVDEPIVDEPIASVSAFAQASEAVLDEPISASGLTGFAGAAEFELEPVLDDYVAPPADEALSMPEFALSADAPELQQPLSLEDAAMPMEHAEAQPMLQAVLDEPIAPATPLEFESILEQLAGRTEAPAASEVPEPFAQTAIEAVVDEPVIAAQSEDELDPLAFRLTEPVAGELIAQEQDTASEPEVAGVPEGVLAFDFETPAPVAVVEKTPVVVSEAAKPMLAEVVPFAARREAARLVVLERFLSRVESRRLALAAQPLAG